MDESKQSKEEDIEQAISMIGSHLLEEGTNKAVEVLFLAGKYICMVMEDDEKLACELSKKPWITFVLLTVLYRDLDE